MSRIDPDFTILARTDAIAVNGLQDAVERANLAIEAGTDYVFMDAAENIEQLRQIPQLVSAPVVANMLPGGKTPILPASELQEIGFAVVGWPTAFSYAYARNAIDFAAHLFRTGTPTGFQGGLIEFDEFNALVGLQEIREAELRHYPHVKDPALRGAYGPYETLKTIG
jgi:2-methylisocitrate lyase-like PEP mutase family enzyme